MPKPPPDLSWDIYRIKATPAEKLGTVMAPSAEAAIERAIEVFGISDPEARRRLIARPRP